MRSGLRERCGVDGIRSFQSAARQRFREGLSLATVGHRAAAIYLWGYAAEMILKVAYFRAVGYEDRQITLNDLHAAKNSAKGLGFSWSGNNLHHLESWANLALLYRSKRLKHIYEQDFESNVVSRVLRIQRHWIESLRYHNSFAYLHEMIQVHDATKWLLDHSSFL